MLSAHYNTKNVDGIIPFLSSDTACLVKVFARWKHYISTAMTNCKIKQKEHKIKQKQLN